MSSKLVDCAFFNSETKKQMNNKESRSKMNESRAKITRVVATLARPQKQDQSGASGHL